MFAHQLQGAHVIAFTLLSTPIGPDAAKHILIDEKEAKELAKVIAEVLQHYSINIDPRMQALVALVFTAGIIYLPRLARISNTVRNLPQQQRQAPASMPVQRAAAEQAKQEKSPSGIAIPRANQEGIVIAFNEYDP